MNVLTAKKNYLHPSVSFIRIGCLGHKEMVGNSGDYQGLGWVSQDMDRKSFVPWQTSMANN